MGTKSNPLKIIVSGISGTVSPSWFYLALIFWAWNIFYLAAAASLLAPRSLDFSSLEAPLETVRLSCVTHSVKFPLFVRLFLLLSSADAADPRATARVSSPTKRTWAKNDLGGGLNFHFQSLAVFLRLRSRRGGKSEDGAEVSWMLLGFHASFRDPADDA